MRGIWIGVCAALALAACMAVTPTGSDTAAQIAAAEYIQRAHDQRAAAQRLLAAARAVDGQELTAKAGIGEIRRLLGYDTLPVARQIQVDALLDSVELELDEGADQDANVVALLAWSAAAGSVAQRCLGNSE